MSECSCDWATGECQAPIGCHAVKAALAAQHGAWQPIETAPKDSYIIGAWRYGSRWNAGQLHHEYDEWIDVHSDRVCSPTHWMPLPVDPEQGAKT